MWLNIGLGWKITKMRTKPVFRTQNIALPKRFFLYFFYLFYLFFTVYDVKLTQANLQP